MTTFCIILIFFFIGLIFILIGELRKDLTSVEGVQKISSSEIYDLQKKMVSHLLRPSQLKAKPIPVKKKPRTEEQKRIVSEKMKQHWEKKKGEKIPPPSEVI